MLLSFLLKQAELVTVGAKPQNEVWLSSHFIYMLMFLQRVGHVNNSGKFKSS